MPSNRPENPSLRPGRREQWATRLALLIIGLAVSAWACMVPLAKQRTGLDEGSLGGLLLCMGIGSILAMPLSGLLATRLGCRRVLAAATLVACALLPLLAWWSAPVALAACLLLFGAAIGTLGCTANIQAVIVEQAAGEPLMSGFHGFFSVGGIAGSALMSLMLTRGCPGVPAAAGLSLLLLLAMLPALRGWLPRGAAAQAGGGAEGPAFAWPRGTVLALGCLCFIVYLAEGAMLDWSAVFLSERGALSVGRAGLGYSCFALAMAVGRLSGDRWVRRLGAVRIVAGGAALAALGLGALVLLPSWQLALPGCACVGLGCANIVPVLFSAVHRQRSMPQSAAVPAINTMGYAGVLAGPAGIGFVAHHSSLAAALLGVALLLAGVAAGARIVRGG